MKCYLCHKEIEQGHLYAYTRSGPICCWCIEVFNWFVPEFSLGKAGFRKSTLEQTQPPDSKKEEAQNDIIDLYIG